MDQKLSLILCVLAVGTYLFIYLFSYIPFWFDIAAQIAFNVAFKQCQNNSKLIL